jgi:hypothetical protein
MKRDLWPNHRHRKCKRDLTESKEPLIWRYFLATQEERAGVGGPEFNSGSISRRLISCAPHGVDFRLRGAKPFDGTISYLTRKHGGNVHDKGIVTITSKSVHIISWLADLTSL